MTMLKISGALIAGGSFTCDAFTRGLHHYPSLTLIIAWYPMTAMHNTSMVTMAELIASNRAIPQQFSAARFLSLTAGSKQRREDVTRLSYDSSLLYGQPTTSPWHNSVRGGGSRVRGAGVWGVGNIDDPPPKTKYETVSRRRTVRECIHSLEEARKQRVKTLFCVRCGYRCRLY